MNQVLLFLLLSFSPGKSMVVSKPQKDKVFYYCDSRPRDRQDFAKKQVIQYAEIKELINDAGSTWKRTVEWASVAHKLCENASGCTADLNSYPTYEAAKIEYDKMIKRYSDTSRYLVRKRDF